MSGFTKNGGGNATPNSSPLLNATSVNSYDSTPEITSHHFPEWDRFAVLKSFDSKRRHC
jgi:hypothetical protein